MILDKLVDINNRWDEIKLYKMGPRFCVLQFNKSICWTVSIWY